MAFKIPSQILHVTSQSHFRRNVRKADSKSWFYKTDCVKDKTTYKEYRSKINPKRNEYIYRSFDGNLHQWVQFKDGGQQYGIMIANCPKSFNSILKSARAFSIQALVAGTFIDLLNISTNAAEHSIDFSNFSTNPALTQNNGLKFTHLKRRSIYEFKLSKIGSTK